MGYMAERRQELWQNGELVRRAGQIPERSRPYLAELMSQLRMPSRYSCSGVRRDEGALP